MKHEFTYKNFKVNVTKWYTKRGLHKGFVTYIYDSEGKFLESISTSTLDQNKAINKAMSHVDTKGL